MRGIRWSGPLLLTFLSALPAAAQTPAGGEFQVNSYTTGDQWISQVAAWEGGFVVVWKSGFSSPDEFIAARLFAPDGSPRGAEITVSGVQMNQFGPQVAADARGNFVVVWGRDLTIAARLFDASGTPRGPQFQVPALTTGQTASTAGSVAMEPDGDFLVVWSSNAHDGDETAAVGRRFDRFGTPLGQEFVVNAYTTGRQGNPAIALDASGAFVVVWTDTYDAFPIGPAAVKVRRFDASGQALGGELRVNAPPGPITPANALVARAGRGEFVVSWAEAPGGLPSIWARRYDATGTPFGPQFQLNTAQVDFNPMPDLAIDEIGNFAVAWQQAPDVAVVRRYDAAGNPRGGAIPANLSPRAFRPRVKSDAVGNLFAVFEVADASQTALDMHGRRFGGLLPAALAVDTGGNRVLEPGESVDVRPSWRNVTTAVQSPGGVLDALSGPPGATYAITDAAASYGSFPDGAIQPCVDCYGVSVSSPPSRPALHWDAAADERIVPDAQGQAKRWRLHVGDSFADVPRSSPFYRFVETILHHGVTGGCSTAAYCPGGATTREQMAVFVLVAREAPGYAPPPCGTPLFADVPASSPFCPWVEELARRGVVGGCGGGNYCPALSASREHMAVFVLRTVDPALNPPPCATPVFADVPASSPFCRWVEELARRGVVTGCGGGNYCPQAPVTREQMSVFLALTFGLALYGP